MTDRRRASGSEDRTREEQNPFAPPPEGSPNQPWQPRHPEGRDGDAGGPDRGDGASGYGNGSRGDSGNRNSGNGGGSGDGQEDNGTGGRRGLRLPWSRQWSARQPGRGDGGFGQNPEDLKSREPRGPRWDPNDPKQRHARYALLAGGWGVFPALLGWEWLALFLAAFGLYWGISALRGAPGVERDDARADARAAQAAASDPDVPEESGGTDGQEPAGSTKKGDPGRRPTLVAAIAGVVLASLTLGMVVGNFTVQMVYQDYFSCAADALTMSSAEACETHLPEVLHPIYIENPD